MMEKLEDIIRTPIFCQIAIFALQFAICLFEIELVRCIDLIYFVNTQAGKGSILRVKIQSYFFAEYHFIFIQFDDIHGRNDIFDISQLFADIFCDYVNH